MLAHTTKKYAKGPPTDSSSYRYFGGGWNLWMSLKYRVVTFTLVLGGNTNRNLSLIHGLLQKEDISFSITTAA